MYITDITIKLIFVWQSPRPLVLTCGIKYGANGLVTSNDF